MTIAKTALEIDAVHMCLAAATTVTVLLYLYLYLYSLFTHVCVCVLYLFGVRLAALIRFYSMFITLIGNGIFLRFSIKYQFHVF